MRLQESRKRTQPATAGPSAPAELRRIALFKDLTDAELSAAFSQVDRRTVRARSILTMASTDMRGKVALVWNGRYRVMVAAPSGVIVTVLSAEDGDTIGAMYAVLGHDPGENVRLMCDETGLLLLLPYRRVLALAQSNARFAEAMMYDLAVRCADHATRFYELAALGVRARLQAELVRLSRTATKVNGVLTLRNAPTQAAIAAQIGAAREAVTRHMKDLANESVIGFRRGVIEFLDLDRLLALDQFAAGRIQFGGKRTES